MDEITRNIREASTSAQDAVDAISRLLEQLAEIEPSVSPDLDDLESPFWSLEGFRWKPGGEEWTP